MTISNVSFNVRFDLTGAPKLVLTDTTGSAPAGMVGIYTITQPDGYVRTGNISSPDTVAGGVFQYNLSPDSIGGPQCGNYTIKLTVTAPGYFSTDFTRTFAFSYAPVSLSLTKNFDIFTPNLSYSDGTNYSVAGYSTGAVTRSWLSNSTPTGNLTSSGVSINLAYQGQYYDAVYTTTLTSSLVYQHTTNAWLSVAETLAKTEVASACTPKPLDELVQMLESFRNGDIDCAGETPDFDRAQILYTHLIDMLRLLLAGGIGQPGVLKVYDDFLFLVRGNQTVPCNHTNQPIPAYDFSDYEVTPFTADAAYCATFGDNVNISYLINHQLNDVCVLAQVYEVATGQQVFADLVVVDPDNVYVTLLSVPTTNQYRIVVHTGLKGLQGPPGPGFPTGGTTGQYLKKQSNANFDTVWFTPEFVTSLTGEATGTGPGATAVTLSNSAVINKVLTGLSVSSGVITQTDSILTAFGKLQGTVSSLVGGVKYAGTWNAATNSPAITSSVGVQGTYYVVSTPGSTSINGITDWKMGDWIIFNGTVWEKVDNTDAVISVNGQTGAVSLTTTNIAEGTNLYYTDVRARAAISLTTTGNSGAATYVNGVLNIPQYQAALTNPVTGTGTTNYVSKFTASGTIGNSQIFDNGTNVGIGTTSPGARLDVTGSASGGTAIRISATNTSSTGGSDAFYYNNNNNYLAHQMFGTAQSGTFLGISNNNLARIVSDASNFAISTMASSPLVFGTNTTERMRLTADGNLGIGTTSPGTLLDVNGTTRSTIYNIRSGGWIADGGANIAFFPQSGGSLQIASVGTFTNGNIVYNASAATGLHAFQTNNVERMRLTSAGELLVAGTNNPLAASNRGNITLNGTSSNILAFTNGGSATGYLFQSTGDMQLLNATSTGQLRFFTNNLDRLAIAASGNVLVGTTIDQGIKLDVQGTLRSTQGANFATSSGSVGIGFESPTSLLHIRGNTSVAATIHNTDFGSNATPAEARLLFRGGSAIARAEIAAQDRSQNIGGGHLLFRTGASTTDVMTDRMMITNTGNVGIGSTTPFGAVDVYRALPTLSLTRNESSVNGNTAILALNPSNAFYNSGFYDQGPSVRGIMEDAAGGHRSGLSLHTYQGSASAERVRIRWDGNVGIGNTSPLTLLHVGAGINASLSNGAGGTFNPQLIHSITSGVAGIMVLVNDGTNNRRAGIFVDQTNAVWGLSQLETTGSIPFVIRNSGGERMRLTAAGDVGIGVTNPANRFEVSAAAITPNTVSTYAIGLGNSTRQIMSFGTDADYGYIQTWGGRKLYLNNQGNDIVTNANVGIRTISPASTLDVTGNISATTNYRFSNNAFSQVAIQDANGAFAGGYNFTLSGTTPQHAATGTSSGYYYSLGTIRFYTDASQAGGSNATERMRLTSAGELLIGTTADNGAFTLQNAGGMYAGPNADNVAIQMISGTAVRNAGSQFHDYGTGGSGSMFIRGGSGLVNALSLLNNGRAVFNGTTDAGFQVDVQGTLRSTQGANFATSSGGVGIGTTSSTGKLLVQGDNDQVILNTTGTWSAMYFRNGGLDRGAFYVNNTDSYVEGRGSNGLTLSGAAVANHVRINSIGNVGIGTTSPDSRLSVTGDGTGIVRIGGGAGGNTASIGLTGSISLTNYTLSGDTGNGNVDINRPTNGSIGFRMNNTSQMVLTPNGDLLIGTTTDSNGTKAIIINNGTAPTNNVTDSAQLYAADQAAGNSCLHTRTENGAVIKLYQETTGVGSATVSSPGGGNTIKTDDTFDGYTIQQIAKALRNQGLLA